MPAWRQNAATLALSCAVAARAALTRSATDRLSVDMAVPLRGGVDRAHDGEGFAEAFACDLERLRRQHRLVEQCLEPASLFFPIHPMLRTHGEIAARCTCRGFPAYRVGCACTAEAGAVLLAVDTEAPVAHPERQARLGEHAGIALDIVLHALAVKT